MTNIDVWKTALGRYIDAGKMDEACVTACHILELDDVDEQTRAMCASVLEADSLEVIPANEAVPHRGASSKDASSKYASSSTPLHALTPPNTKRRGASSSGQDPNAPTASELATVGSMQRDADALRAEAKQLVQRGELLKSILPNETSIVIKLGRLRRLLGP